MTDEKEILGKLPELSPLLAGPLMAFCLTILRALYDKKEPRYMRIFLEASICACVTVGVMAGVWLALIVFNVPIEKEYQAFLSAGAGAFCGYIGVERLRRFILGYLDRQIND